MKRVFKRRHATIALGTVLLLVAALAGIGVASDDKGATEGLSFSEAGVVVDEAAAARIAATSHVKNLQVFNFQPFGAGPDYSWSGGGCITTSSGGLSFFEAPFELPVGAEIKGMSLHFFDTGASNVSLTMAASTQEGANPPSQPNLISVSSSGTPGYGEITGIPTNPVFVDDNEFFFIEAFLNVDTQLCGVEVFYDIPSSGDNLVFTPLDAPCKVFDTFTAPAGAFKGPIGPDDGLLSPVIATPTAGEVADQGGDPLCAETAVPADAVAVSINFTTRNITQKGNIRAAASGAATKPVVNFSNTAVMNNSNELTIGLAGGAIDFEIGGQASGDDSLNVSGVVFGYYTPLPNFAG